MKDWATLMLTREGCKKVETEFQVNVGGKRYVVDVVGFGEKSFAVECIDTARPSEQKIRDLETVFDEIIILDGDHLLLYYEQVISTLLKEKRMLLNLVKKPKRPTEKTEEQIWSRFVKTDRGLRLVSAQACNT